MTSSNTEVKAAANGQATTETQRPHGLRVLREIEAKALISLATDAMSQAVQVSHEMHSLLYDRKTRPSYERLQQLLEEALACWEIGDHYLRMLDEAIEPDGPLTEEPIPYQTT